MGIDRVPGARSHIVAGAAATALALVLSACGQENRYVAPPPPKGMSRVLLKLAKRSLPSMILRDFEL
jgi:hypothetical protein